MSWRIAIGFNTPWADASWIEGDNICEAQRIIKKYGWWRPLRISYLQGYEEMARKFCKMLKEEGIDYNNESVDISEVSFSVVRHHVDPLELHEGGG